jgi:CubicO group peptidase (beta-lactamase class C family)
VRGIGDGGIYSTAADVHAFWAALLEGRILPTSDVDEMVRPRSEGPSPSLHHGLGFWLRPAADAVFFEGADAGISFRSLHVRASGVTYTVLSNTSDGAWPVARRLEELLLR